ncbi:hypothetical protein C0081_21300 [Cohaesibacter celericrescens]|uniref:Solute-binding protein family 3/N-terminal domain-containing protein n=1 Tax=Cohaesibacter celericrescens TaxID=2067669 RepID=A0A2N5XK12_9HYPH|nr:hypothetical protein C0081_21300 [Cohaesibacter celericrescens]
MGSAISIAYSKKLPTLSGIRYLIKSSRSMMCRDYGCAAIPLFIIKFLVVFAVSLPLLTLSSHSYAQGTLDATTGEATTSETESEPQDETENRDEENPDSLETGVSLRNRPAQANGPVASEPWAKAGFYGFIDTRQRLGLPDQELLDKGLRILTTDDFPPFNNRDENGAPQGYHVELARALCEELSTPCTLKIAAFEDIPDLIANGQADVALAGLVNHPSLKDVLDFSNVYLQRPARFARLKEKFFRTDTKGLAGKPVAVRGGSAHEAYLKAYFPTTNRVPVTDLEDARQLLTDEKVDAIFGDAFQLLPMISEADSPIIFAGKPFYDTHFFGDGMAVAYGHNQTDLGNMLNYGLLKLAQKGRMSELYARHFALDVYATY